MVTVEGTTITIVKGDSAKITISLFYNNGNEYIPTDGDVINFYLKEKGASEASTPKMHKVIPSSTLVLDLTSTETKQLSSGKYNYDIELVKADGYVDTFINMASLVILPEVG